MAKQTHFFSVFCLTMITGLLLLTISCEDKFDWDYEQNTIEIPVIEGIITNEYIQHSLRLSLVRSDPNESSSPITDATVHVIVGSAQYSFSHNPLEPGTWVSDVQFFGVTGENIRLEVVYKGINYNATDVMIPVSASARAYFGPLENDSTKFQLVNSPTVFSSSEEAMWEFFVFWDFLPEYAGVPADSCKARLFVYDLNILDIGQVFAPPKQPLYFPLGARVYQTKYSLSPQHSDFRHSMLQETEWRGGLFDVSPGNVNSNVSDGGVGFFGACSVVRDTFDIE